MLDCEKCAASLASLPKLTLKRIFRFMPLPALAELAKAASEVVADRIQEGSDEPVANYDHLRSRFPGSAGQTKTPEVLKN